MSKRRFATSARQAKAKLKADISRTLHSYGAVDFFNTLAGPLGPLTDALSPPHRERLYPPTVTLSMLMSQVLNADPSCQRVVNEWSTMRIVEGLPRQSVGTGGYCRARKRLPVEMVRGLTRASGKTLCASALDTWRWKGRTVKLIDGTGLSMPDTARNRAIYPLRKGQVEGVGFPLARLVATICLSTGAILDAAMAPFGGKGHGEHSLMRALLGGFSVGDVVLGDALYSSYWIVAALQASNVDAVFRQNGGRHTDFRRGQRLGKRDHVVEWKKPAKRPAWMSPEAYAAVAPTLTMREVRCGGLTLVTTLRDCHAYGAAALGELYAQRWHVELDLRNIKSTLGIDILRCQTPEMVEKEVWAGLLAYNLIRTVMVEAALREDRLPREVSFKHAAQSVELWLQHRCYRLRPDAIDALYRNIARCRVGKRQGRSEPRQRKRRPKFGDWMTQPRHAAKSNPPKKAQWGVRK